MSTALDIDIDARIEQLIQHAAYRLSQSKPEFFKSDRGFVRRETYSQILDLKVRCRMPWVELVNINRRLNSATRHQVVLARS